MKKKKISPEIMKKRLPERRLRVQFDTSEVIFLFIPESTLRRIGWQKVSREIVSQYQQVGRKVINIRPAEEEGQ